MGIDLKSIKDPAKRKRIEFAMRMDLLPKAKLPNAPVDATEAIKFLDKHTTIKAKGKMKRHVSGKMNKTEARYYTDHLECLYPVILFESVKLRLADNTYYTPDFMTIDYKGAITFHEVKGGWFMDDARVKWKVCAEQYPWFNWKWCTYKSTKIGWKVEDYG